MNENFYRDERPDAEDDPGNGTWISDDPGSGGGGSGGGGGGYWLSGGNRRENHKSWLCQHI